MLKKVRFENYRCLKKVTIDLEPLTVLVGPNASGKSAALRALDPAYAPVTTDVWRHSQQTLEIGLSSVEGGEWVRRLPGSSSLEMTGRRPFSRAQLLDLDLQALRSQNLVTEAAFLDTKGSNLTNAFATLARKQQDEVARRFAELVPMFADVTARPTGSGNHHLIFQDAWDESTWYTGNEVSDGTMLLLAYLVAQYQASEVELLTIEEPERGLHPYLMGELISLLRRMSRGEVGRKKVQIVLATHSAELLDHVEPSEVRFLSRNDTDGSVSVETIPADSPGWREAFREYAGSLGSVWLSGGIGGVPKT